MFCGFVPENSATVNAINFWQWVKPVDSEIPLPVGGVRGGDIKNIAAGIFSPSPCPSLKGGENFSVTHQLI